jgi:hypothetical protein
MLKLRRLLSSLALSAVVGLMASECRAETISMTVSVTGAAAPLVLDGLAGVTPGATSYNVSGNAGPGNYPGTGAFTAINAYLAANGSAYQLTALAGQSNFPGSPLPASLSLTGDIHAVATGGSNLGLTITETESGFTNPPPGSVATLTSSTVGNFNNQPAGGGHDSHSLLNAIATPTSGHFSTGIGPNPGELTPPSSVPIPSVPTLYTLTNVITWGATGGTPPLGKPATGAADITETSFGVVAAVGTVPEPASLVVFLTGMPLPLAVVFGLMRRRRGAAAG